MSGKTERSSSPQRPPRSRGRLIAQGIYLAIAGAFIVSATWQVQRQVFGGLIQESHTIDPNCNYAIGSLDESVLAGMALASQTPSPGKSDEVYEDKVDTALSGVEKRCRGADIGAYAAALRLTEAAHAALDDQHTVLSPLRAAIKVRRNP